MDASRAAAHPSRPGTAKLCWLAILAVPPALVLADYAIAFARGWTTSSDRWQVIAGLAALWLLGVGWLAATRRGREWFRRSGGRLVALVVSLALSWLLAETVVALALRPVAHFHLAAPGMHSVFPANPELIRGIFDASHYRANSQGIRGPEWPARDAALRILCVGGSTTECVRLDDDETWPQRLAASLAASLAARPAAAGGRVWVGDVGRSGFSTRAHVELMENAELLSQVDWLVFLVGINDLLAGLRGERIDRPLGVAPLVERSPLLQVIDQIRHTRRMQRRHRQETADAAMYVNGRQNRRAAVRASAADFPDLRATRDEYRRNLERIADRCAELGLQVAFATQPVLWRADLPASDDATLWLGMQRDGRAADVGALAKAMEEFNDVLRNVCAERGIDCIELAGLSGRSELFYDDCHFTEAGAEAVGDAVAHWFRRRGPR